MSVLLRLAGASGALGLGGYILNESLFDVDGGHGVVLFDTFRGVIPTPYGQVCFVCVFAQCMCA